MGAAITAVLAGGADPQAVIVTVGDGYGAVDRAVHAGDSNVAKGQPDQTDIAKVLTDLMGIPVANYGVGGDITGSTGSRLNVEGLRATVIAAFVVPAGAPAPVGFDFLSPNKPLKNDTVPTVHGYFLLAGGIKVAGTITKLDFSLPNNPFVFTIDTDPGVDVTVPAGCEWYSDLGDVYREYGLLIFQAGGNDLGGKPDSYTYDEIIQLVLDNWRKVQAWHHGQVLFIGPPNGTGSEPGTDVYDDGIVPFVAAATAEFEGDFLDVRPLIIARGIDIATAAGLMPDRTAEEIAADDLAMANDTIPPSLRANDPLGAHYNVPGRYVEAYLIREYLQQQTIPSPLPDGSFVTVSRSSDGDDPTVIRGGARHTPPGGLFLRADSEPPLGRAVTYSAVVESSGAPTSIELVAQVNVTPNPSGEVAVTGWAASNGSTLTRVSAVNLPENTGSWVMRTVAAGGGLGVAQIGPDPYFSGPITPGDPVTGVAWVKGPVAAAAGGVAVQFYNAAGTAVGPIKPGVLVNCASGDWTRLTYTWTVPAGATKARLRVLLYSDLERNDTRPGDSWDIAAAALIVRSIQGDYFDGDTEGASWEGTPHLSVSTLTGEKAIGGSPAATYLVSTQVTVPWTANRHVFTDPLTAEHAFVDMPSDDAERNAKFRGSLLTVFGRARPVSQWDTRGSDEGTIVVTTRDRAETRQLKKLLASGSPLVSRHQANGSDHPAVETLTLLETPNRRRFAEADNRHGGRLFQLGFQVVDPPEPETAPPVATLADLYSAYAGRTLTDLAADYGTLLELLSTFRPIGETIAPPPGGGGPTTPPLPVPVTNARPAYDVYRAFGMNTHFGFIGGTGLVTDVIGTIRSGTRADLASAATSIVVPYPSAPAAGELLFLVYASSGAPTVPAGWSSQEALDATNRTTVMWKHATGSESGSLTLTTPSQTGTAQMYAVPGVDGVTLDVAAAVAATTGTSLTTLTAATASNVVTTGSVAIYAISTGAGASTTYTGPAGSTEVADWGSVGSNARAGAVYRDTTALTSGAAVSRTVTASTARRMAMVMLVLRPSTSGSAPDPNREWQKTVDYLLDLDVGLVRQKLYADAGTPRANTRLALQQLMGAGVRVVMPTLNILECTSLAAARTAMDAYVTELVGNPSIYDLSLIDSFPGLNEPNGSAPGSGAVFVTADWAQRTRWAQQAIAEKVRAHPLLKHIPTQGPPLQKPVPPRATPATPWNVVLAADVAAIGDLSQWVDRADAHVYTAEQDSTTGRSELLDAARALAGATKPLQVTEQGWSNTSLDDPDGADYLGGAKSTPESVTAFYAVKQALNAVHDGLLASIAYEMLENPTPYDNDTAHREGKFGYIRVPSMTVTAWSPKAQFVAVRRLLSLVKDTGATFTAAALNVAVTGPPTLRSLLLQRRTGEWLLVLWRVDDLYESDPSNNSGTYLDPAPAEVAVQLATARSMTIYQPTLQDAPVRSATGAQVTELVGKHVHVIRLAAGGGTVPPPPPPPPPPTTTGYRPVVDRGDSLARGTAGGGTPEGGASSKGTGLSGPKWFPRQFQARVSARRNGTAPDVVNEAYGGATTRGAAARQGSRRWLIPSVTVPAAGGIIDTSNDVEVLGDPAQQYPMPASILGIPGELTRVDTGQPRADQWPYWWKRTSGVGSLVVPASTELVFDEEAAHLQKALLLWVGHNDAPDFAGTAALIEQMVDYQSAPAGESPMVCVVGLIKADRSIGLRGGLTNTEIDDLYAAIDDVNADLATRLGDILCPMAGYLSGNDGDILGDLSLGSPTAAEVTDTADGTPLDRIQDKPGPHLNDLGNKAAGYRVADHCLDTLGWYPL